MYSVAHDHVVVRCLRIPLAALASLPGSSVEDDEGAVTTYTVRPYQEEDAPAACAVIMACIPVMAGLNALARQFLLTKNQPGTLHAELARYFSLVVVHGDTLVGIGALDRQEIKRVYVDPTYQGRGYGRALLQHLEAEAQRRGIREVWIESSPNAERFYARWGYTAHTRDHLAIGHARFAFVRMSKVLGDKHDHGTGTMS